MSAAGGEKIPRELRVRLDADLHQKLQMLKLLRNKTMTDTIHEALLHYFDAVVAPDEENRLR